MPLQFKGLIQTVYYSETWRIGEAVMRRCTLLHSGWQKLPLATSAAEHHDA